MPRLNRVFEEMKVKYGNCRVPGVARPAGVAIQSQVSPSRPDEDLMGSSIKATAVAGGGGARGEPVALRPRR